MLGLLYSVLSNPNTRGTHMSYMIIVFINFVKRIVSRLFAQLRKEKPNNPPDNQPEVSVQIEFSVRDRHYEMVSFKKKGVYHTKIEDILVWAERENGGAIGEEEVNFILEGTDERDIKSLPTDSRLDEKNVVTNARHSWDQVYLKSFSYSCRVWSIGNRRSFDYGDETPLHRWFVLRRIS